MPQIEEFPAIEEFPTEDELRASLGGEGTPIPRSPEELAMQNLAARGGTSAGDVRPPGSGIIPEFRAPAGASLPVKVGAGILNTAGSVGNFFLSPEGVATMIAPEIVGPKIAAPVAKALFGGLMAKSAGEMAGKASVTGDAQDVTEAALAGLGAGLAGLHGSLPPRPEGFIGPIATGESLPMPRGSPPWRRPAFQLPDVTPKLEESQPIAPKPAPEVSAPKPEAEVAPTIQSLWKEYDEGGEITERDLMEHVRGMAEDEPGSIPQYLIRAAQKYRKAVEDDFEMAGRGDVEPYQDAFMAAFEKAATAKPKKVKPPIGPRESGQGPAQPESPPVVTQGAPSFAAKYDPEILMQRPGWVEPGSKLDQVLGDLREKNDPLIGVDIAPIWKTLDRTQRQDLASRGWIVTDSRDPKAVILKLAQDVPPARKYYGVQARQSLKSPPTAPTEAPPPVVEARPPETAIGEAATVGKGKEGVVELRPGARGPWLGRSIDDSFSEAQKGYPKAKEALKGWGDDDLAQERNEMIKASLNPMFGANAKRALKLIEEEIAARQPAPTPPQPSTPPPPIYKSIEGAKVEPDLPSAKVQDSITKALRAVDTITGNTKKHTLENAFASLNLHAEKLGIPVGKLSTYFDVDQYRKFAREVQLAIGQKYGSHPTAEMRAKRDQIVADDLAAKAARKAKREARVQTPPPAAAKVQTEVAKVAATEGQRSAKEVKAEYVQRLEDAIAKAKSEEDYPGLKMERNAMERANYIPNEDLWAKAKKEIGTVTIDIPGDGITTILNTKEALTAVLKSAKSISTTKGTAPKVPKVGEGKTKVAEDAEAAAKAYGSPEAAYKSARNQLRQIQSQEPPRTAEEREEWNTQIQGANALIDELYHLTKAGKLDSQAEAARDRVGTYKVGAEGFETEIARLEKIKRKTQAHKDRLEDLKERYKQNQDFISTNTRNAEQWEQQAAKEKAALEAEPTTAPPAATGEGMPLKQSIGGAVPAEFEGNESFVSNMFAAIDRDRTELGLPPMEETIPRTWKAARAKAEAMLKTDPFWISELIARTNLEPRPMLDHEIVGTVLQRAKWKAELNEAWRRIGRATEDGHPELAKDDQLLAAQMLDKIQLLDKTVGRNGSASEAGRTLNAQKMALDDDLNLVSMVLKRQADTGKKVEPGSPEFEELKKIAEEYKRTSEALQADLNSKEARVSELNAKLALEAIEKEQLRKQIPDLSPKVLEVARKWVEKWDKEATQAMNNLLGKSWSPTPEMLLDLAKVARGNMAHLGFSFAEWSVKMTEKLGKGVEQFLQGAWDRALKMIDEEAGITEPVKRAIKKTASDAEKQADLTERLKAKLKDKRLEEITPLVQKLARTFSDQGVRGWRGIGDAVHGVLKELIPGLDYRDTLDAISGHGKFRLPDQAEGAKALRDAKSQMQEVRKIQEVISRQPVKPTGLKRDFPSDIKRRLTQIYENAKRKFGIVITDPATQLRSALQARKTYYEHRISDLQAEINSKKRTVKTKAPSPTDPALEKLIAEYKQVKAAHDEVFGPRELTDAERAAREEKSLDRQIAEVERQIKEGDIFPRTPGERPTSPAIEAKRANLLALKSEREYLRESIQPTQYLTAEEKQLKAIKAGLARNIADKTARMARGDFAPKAKRPPPTLDAETLRLRAENQRVVKEYRRMEIKDELAKASPAQRAIAMALRLRRFEVLSGIHSIYKLASYSLQKLAGTPPEEALGAGLMKLPGLRTVGEKSTEVGYNTANEIEYIKKGFTQGIRDAQQVWKRGESDLGAVYDPRIQKDVEWTGFFGRLHLMEKSVLLRIAFERAKDRLIEKAAAEGQPVSDEAVQLRIGIEAYNYAMQEILMNPNVLSKRVNRFLNSLEEKQKDTGRPRSSLTTLKAALELKLPIRNVPVNYIARTMDYVVGTEMGLSKLGMAFSRGIETLTPAEANAIKRHLTRGLVGKAVMALGFFNPNIFGGYYEPGEKRRKDEPKALTMQVYGHNIPTFLLHNPLLEAAQFGATIRRIADSKIRKRDQNTQGISSGVVGAVIGLLDETPYIRGMADYGKLRDPRQRGQALANEVRSLLIPQLLQNIAQDFDKDAQGERIIRRPQTFMQGIQVGIPGLRQQVPMSPKSSQSGGAIPSFVPTVQQR